MHTAGSGHVLSKQDVPYVCPNGTLHCSSIVTPDRHTKLPHSLDMVLILFQFSPFKKYINSNIKPKLNLNY